MSSGNAPIHGLWSNHFTYILAAIGAAVGLGNIWKFPYIVGENGGGAFVLVYLFCIAFIGVPVMISEVLLGKMGRRSPGNAAAILSKQQGLSKNWAITGWLGVIAGYLVLSFYAMIAGWTLAYVFEAGQGKFQNASPEQISSIFSTLTSSPETLIFWTACVLALVAIVVALGVKDGLERVVKFLTPALLTLLVVIAIYASQLGDFEKAFSFLFNPDFSKLTSEGVLVALGHSFFTLGLASGVVMMYGAYLPDNVSIVKTSIWISIADTLVALLAGIAIYPIVFGYGLEPGAGPGLIFITIPIALGQMPGGVFFGTLFFVMLVLAAFTSAISMIEASVAWLVEQRGFKRWQAATISATTLFCLSLLSIFSVTGASWAQVDFNFLGKHVTHLFDIIDHLTSDILLPIGGFILAIFTGWKLSTKSTIEALNTHPTAFKLWQFTLRWIAPVAIGIVFLDLIGVITFS